MHDTNQLLRRNGFKLHSRPAGQEPIWRLGHQLLPQRVALQMCKPEEASQATEEALLPEE